MERAWGLIREAGEEVVREWLSGKWVEVDEILERVPNGGKEGSD